MIQKLKNDKNRDDSLLFQTAQFAAVFSTTVTILIDVGPMTTSPSNTVHRVHIDCCNLLLHTTVDVNKNPKTLVMVSIKLSQKRPGQIIF